MSKSLAIPIHLDALLLKNATVVKDAVAEYSRLPFTDGKNDYNSDIPYISEAILNHSFQDKIIAKVLPWQQKAAINYKFLNQNNFNY